MFCNLCCRGNFNRDLELIQRTYEVRNVGVLLKQQNHSKPDNRSPFFFSFFFFFLAVFKKNVLVQEQLLQNSAYILCSMPHVFISTLLKVHPHVMSLLWNVSPRAVYTGSWQRWPAPGCLCPLSVLWLINILDI